MTDSNRYGLNFGCTDIPEMWRKKFRSSRRSAVVDARVAPTDERVRTDKIYLMATLQGLCFTEPDLERMLMVANNQRRYIWVLQAHGAFAIYIW